jgi:glycerol-3-phosphate O-acyltransferase
MLSGSEEEKSLSSIVFYHDLLKKTFGKEFLFDNSENIEDKVLSIINYFLEEGLIRQSTETGGYSISKAGYDRLSSWAALAKTFIESYWITANVMIQHKDEKISSENLMKRIIDAGNKYYDSNVIEHIGAISRINFQNAVTYINREVLASEDEKGNKAQDYDRLTEFSRQLHEFMN